MSKKKANNNQPPTTFSRKDGWDRFHIISQFMYSVLIVILTAILVFNQLPKIQQELPKIQEQISELRMPLSTNFTMKLPRCSELHKVYKPASCLDENGKWSFLPYCYVVNDTEPCKLNVTTLHKVTNWFPDSGSEQNKWKEMGIIDEISEPFFLNVTFIS